MPGDVLYYGDNLDVLRRHVADESVEELLDGRAVDYPRTYSEATSKKAPKAEAGGAEQLQIEH